MARDQRRLAAIVCADVAGFSRLMGVDEAGTLASLKSHLHAHFEPKISEYGGRIVKTTGDGLLVEFASVVDAVRCAVDVQRGMAERNVGVGADKRIDFRIGINVGDIIIAGDDIFGDGVNVAARLQTLADPGEICVSKVVRDQVLDKLSFNFEDLGAQKVKNIARPVEVYRVELGNEALPASCRGRTHWPRLVRSSGWRWLGASALVLGIVGVVAWALPQFRKPAPPYEPPAFSLAVLPFTVPGGTPADRQFADLMTQGFTRALGRTMHSLTIVSVPVGATETNKVIDVRELGRERNVRYVLEANTQIEGDSANVAARLVDAETAIQLWTGQLDGARSKWVAGPDYAFWPLINGLRGALWTAEEQRVAHRSPGSTSSPWDLLVRASILERNRTPKQLMEARELVDEALRRDPNFAPALLERVWIDGLIWENDSSANRAQLAQEMDEFARRALAIDRTNPWTWRARSYAFGLQWRWDAALNAADEAGRLDPSNPYEVIDRSWLLSMMGQSDEALRSAEQALAREPSLDINPNFRHNQCYAQLLLGLFDTAVSSCEKSVAGGDDWWPHFFLTVAYAQIGDMSKAAMSKAELLRRRPGFTIAQFNTMGLSDNPVYLKQAEAHVIPGLRKAGIPEK